MPAKPRSEIFFADEVGVYHCWNKLVRKEFLFGYDALRGKDCSYRKHQARDDFKQLAGGMAIDILDYAFLDNHLHIVLRNRPDIVATWSDEEVARRWWYVCPDRKNKDGSIPDPKPCEIKLLLQDVDEYRSRLSDISWMMRLACQRIATRANKEDDVTGRFFGGRFNCSRLETLAGIFSCSLYVDLNLIHAAIATTPEESEFTSAFDRIRARWQQAQSETGGNVALPSEEEADAWLAPVFLDERADAYVVTPTPGSDGDEASTSKTICNPIGSARISNLGFLPITRNQYLSLLDFLGRIVRDDKRGSIPSELAPIMQRLGIDAKSWLDHFLDSFRQHAASALSTPTAGYG